MPRFSFLKASARARGSDKRREEENKKRADLYVHALEAWKFPARNHEEAEQEKDHCDEQRLTGT